MSARGGYTVSGPGIDRSYHDPGPALSAAITCASRRGLGEATFYVRDQDGNAYGRAEHDGHGTIHVYRKEA